MATSVSVKSASRSCSSKNSCREPTWAISGSWVSVLTLRVARHSLMLTLSSKAKSKSTSTAVSSLSMSSSSAFHSRAGSNSSGGKKSIASSTSLSYGSANSSIAFCSACSQMNCSSSCRGMRSTANASCNLGFAATRCLVFCSVALLSICCLNMGIPSGQYGARQTIRPGSSVEVSTGSGVRNRALWQYRCGAVPRVCRQA